MSVAKISHQLIVKLLKSQILYCLLHLAIVISLGAQSNNLNPPIAYTEPTPFKPKDFNLTINSWNRQDGFPSWQIFNLFQDSRGILWVGAKQGLYSFDGYEFKDYEAQTQGEDRIYQITEDVDRNIWFEHFSLGALVLKF